MDDEEADFHTEVHQQSRANYMSLSDDATTQSQSISDFIANMQGYQNADPGFEPQFSYFSNDSFLATALTQLNGSNNDGNDTTQATNNATQTVDQNIPETFSPDVTLPSVHPEPVAPPPLVPSELSVTPSLPVAQPRPSVTLPHTHTEWAERIDEIRTGDTTFIRYYGGGCYSCSLHSHQTCGCGSVCRSESPDSNTHEVLKTQGKIVFLDFDRIHQILRALETRVCPPLQTADPSNDVVSPDVQDNIQRSTQRMQIDMILGGLAMLNSAELNPRLRNASQMVQDDDDVDHTPILHFRPLMLDSLIHKIWSDPPIEWVSLHNAAAPSVEHKMYFAAKKFIALWSTIANPDKINLKVPCFDDMSNSTLLRDEYSAERHRAVVERKRKLLAFALLEGLIWQLQQTFDEFMSSVNRMALMNQELQNRDRKTSHALRYCLTAVIHGLHTTKVDWFGDREAGECELSPHFGNTDFKLAGAADPLRSLQYQLEFCRNSLRRQLLLYECWMGRVSKTSPSRKQPRILTLKTRQLVLRLDVLVHARVPSGPASTDFQEDLASPKSMLDVLCGNCVEDSPPDHMVAERFNALFQSDFGLSDPMSIDTRPISSPTTNAIHESTGNVLGGPASFSSRMDSVKHSRLQRLGGPSSGKRTTLASSADSSLRSLRPPAKRQRTTDTVVSDQPSEDGIPFNGINVPPNDNTSPQINIPPSVEGTLGSLGTNPVVRISLPRLIGRKVRRFARTAKDVFAQAIRYIGA